MFLFISFLLNKIFINLINLKEYLIIMIIDVHSHLDLLTEEKVKEIGENKKIKLVITNSVDLKTSKKSLKLNKMFSKIKVAVGLYPGKELKLSDFNIFENFVRKNKESITAIGEIGLDLHHTKENFEIQKAVFIKELELAKQLEIPVIIHSRKAEKEVLEILESFPKVKVLLHCFSGNFKLITKGIERGYYFSIPTNVNRSEHFQKMLELIPRKKILTETDSPYLSPHKDKENEPIFIEESIKKISEIWKNPEDKVEKQIEDNFNKLFSVFNN
ncbi:hypothetical protein CO037_00470 [Candidatus Pacearchaeota archaeon CG_4_9_14_0_2_um_filter_30_8]|nr:MAG: hypothetical protein CO037_00470 [Candidatus Pacearchaeota archaeon CG_4_9_14_0_2_um_filter_30_8]